MTDNTEEQKLFEIWAKPKGYGMNRSISGYDNGEYLSAPTHHAWRGWKGAVAANNESFQSRVAPWMQACFGPAISADREERNHRFLEEALELVQACGATREECLQLADYVYGRPVGDPPQEVGGVMVTLAALCLASGFDMHQAGETELARIWTKVEQIRAKQAGKPKGSPLPQAVRSTASARRGQEGELGDECFAPSPAS